MRMIFTIGTFDVLSEKDIRLFHEMRKASIPGGEIYALVYDDYAAYKNTGKFPIQSYSQRVDNIKYFIRNFLILELEDPGKEIERFRHFNRPEDKYICVMYDDNKDFPGRSMIKKLGIPIKFIKYEQNNNSNTTARR